MTLQMHTKTCRDEILDRFIQLGWLPCSTFKSFLSNSEWKHRVANSELKAEVLETYIMHRVGLNICEQKRERDEKVQSECEN